MKAEYLRKPSDKTCQVEVYKRPGQFCDAKAIAKVWDKSKKNSKLVCSDCLDYYVESNGENVQFIGLN